MKRTLQLLCLTLVCSAPALAYALPVGRAAKPGPQRASATSTAAGQRTAALMKPAATPASKHGAVASKQAGGKPCYAKPVQLLRVRGLEVEPREVSLTLCNGAPNPSALDSVSVLGRPRDAERPLLPEIRAYRARPLPQGKVSPRSKLKYRDPMFLTEHVMRLNPGLLLRLQKIAKRYPGKTIEIISGYRPDARETSRHHHGQALDLRVAGVTRERLRDYLRTFEDTGVGYYPNSFFVHMDVREAKAYWVDRSGPGEPADYGPWQPPAKKHGPAQLAHASDRVDKARDNVLKGALADLAALRGPVLRANDKRSAMNGVLPAKARNGHNEPPQGERDDMSQDEVTRARAEARRALDEMDR